MKENFSALIAGLIFGLGLTVSQMVNPEKVLGFLDVTGNWDPSLAFVMGGGLATTFVGYRLVWKREKPLLANSFQVPGNRDIDLPLAVGAIMFGVGWGLVGLCPGPAIAAVTIGGTSVLKFVAAMVAGIFVYEISPFNPNKRSQGIS